MLRIVLDTNVIVAALRSRRGASNRLLALIGTGRFTTVLSVPLVLEYEDALGRMGGALAYSPAELEEILDFVCGHSEHRSIYYLWRPFLGDAKDDHVLEVAVAGSCSRIVTFNVRDFQGVDRFGLKVQRPKELLQEIGGIP